MKYTDDFVSEDLKSGDRVRDIRDGAMHTIGNRKGDSGWEIFPDIQNTEEQSVSFYVPDNRLPGNLELLIDD